MEPQLAARKDAEREPQLEEVDEVTIRFCGDSGDGMQLTGMEFTRATAIAGNDLQTFPDYPAEIRAPAGTIAGVSGFQICFANRNIFTPGDAPDVLVAMNPAALKSNLPDLRPGGTLVVNTGAFVPKNLELAGYARNPLEDGSLDGYRLHQIDISKLTATALSQTSLTMKEVARAKNMFALGMMLWLYQRPTEPTIQFLQAKFRSKPDLLEANLLALKAGLHYGENAEIFAHTFVVRKAPIAPGTYRNISGNEAMALGLTAAAQLSGLKLFLGSYPITPATDILHELAKFAAYNVETFQAEDEIAAVGSAIGAAFGGCLGVTTTSGPGLALKQEAINLALMTELPLVIIDVQRGGPSTGLPTKVEQADLLQALWGRNGESPMPLLAPAGPGECFATAIEAARLAIKYMTPVIVLSDASIANGLEPWKIPDAASLPKIEVEFRTDPVGYNVYGRDPETLARPWVRPGTPGLEHRIGGLEKDHVTGMVSYDSKNHDEMCRTRAAKVAGMAREIPPTKLLGEASGDVLVIGWGSSHGAIAQAVRELQRRGRSISAVHIRHLNPLPPDLAAIAGRFKQVVIPELNLGQLARVLRAELGIESKSICKLEGKPFQISELVARIEEALS